MRLVKDVVGSGWRTTCLGVGMFDEIKGQRVSRRAGQYPKS